MMSSDSNGEVSHKGVTTQHQGHTQEVLSRPTSNGGSQVFDASEEIQSERDKFVYFDSNPGDVNQSNSSDSNGKVSHKGVTTQHQCHTEEVLPASNGSSQVVDVSKEREKFVHFESSPSDVTESNSAQISDQNIPVNACSDKCSTTEKKSNSCRIKETVGNSSHWEPFLTSNPSSTTTSTSVDALTGPSCSHVSDDSNRTVSSSPNDDSDETAMEQLVLSILAEVMNVPPPLSPISSSDENDDSLRSCNNGK